MNYRNQIYENGKMNKVFEKIYKIALGVLCICTIYSFIISLIGKKSVYDYNVLVLIVGLFLYLGVVCSIYRQSRKITDKRLDYFAVALLVVYLLLTLVFGLGIKSERPKDVFNLHNAAVSYLQFGKIENTDYFSVYPFQLNHTYFLILIYKLGKCIGIADYRTSGTLAGAILLFLSAYLTYKIACRIKNKNFGCTCLFVFASNPVFWIYSSYYYTDLPGMTLILLTIDIALSVNESNIRGRNLLRCILLGIVVIIGLKMRAVAAIGGIAVFVLGIVKYINNKEKILIKYFFTFCLGILIALMGGRIVENYFAIDLNINLKFPIPYYIMVGLSEEGKGKWSSELWNYTYSFPTYSAKIAANVDAIKHSLSDMGFLGIINLFCDKLGIMWADGMTALITNFQTSAHYGFLYKYTIGNRNAITCYYTQGIRSFLLLCTIPYLFSEMKNGFSKKSIFAIIFFGCILFYFFWEVHEKYALMFLPILCIMAVYGLSIVIEMISNLKNISIVGTKIYEIDKKKISVICQQIMLKIFIITVMLSIFCWNSTVLKTDNRYDFIVYQSESTGSFQVGTEKIRQTFSTDKNFNEILVKFITDDVLEEQQQYTFALYDESNTCVCQEVFQVEALENNAYYVFGFDEIDVNGVQEFYFEIVANEEYENTLQIGSAGNNYADYYPNGEAYISDYEIGDLTFRVYYYGESSYYSKVFYITMFSVIFLLEGFIYWRIENLHGKKWFNA